MTPSKPTCPSKASLPITSLCEFKDLNRWGSGSTQTFRSYMQTHRKLKRECRQVLCTFYLVSPNTSITVWLQYRMLTMYSVCVLSCVTVSHVEVSAAMKTNRIQNCRITTKISRRVPLDSHSPASVIPNPREPLIWFTTHNVVLSRMLQTWAHTVRDLQRLTFSFFHFNVIVIQVVWWINSSVLLIAE